MSDHFTTQHNHYKAALSALKDAWSGIKIFKLSAEQGREYLAEKVWDTNHYKRLTQTRKEHLRGYYDCLFDTLWYGGDLFWGIELKDGTVAKMYDIHKHPDFPGWNWISDHNERCHHYWTEPKVDGSFAQYS